MSRATYEAKFLALYHCDTQVFDTKKERIQLYITGLNTNLKVLLVHMTFAGKIFNEVFDYIKKLEGFKQFYQANALAKKSQNTGNFSVFYFKGHIQQAYPAWPIQFVFPSSIMGPARLSYQLVVMRGQGASYLSIVGLLLSGVVIIMVLLVTSRESSL